MSTSAARWLAAFAQAIDASEPDEAARQAILDLAGAAAHGSERTAAPVACWLAASVGLSPRDACAVARALVVPEVGGDPS